jgi:hypothetical protein
VSGLETFGRRSGKVRRSCHRRHRAVFHGHEKSVSVLFP